MKVFTEERVKVIADKNGWSQAYAQGFVEGESFRRHGSKPSKYAEIGIDDYSLGFRAGYYERGQSSTRNSPAMPDAPNSALLRKSQKTSGDSSS
jgi:hypothetical protein